MKVLMHTLLPACVLMASVLAGACASSDDKPASPSPAPGSGSAPVQTGETCNAAPAQSAVGKAATNEVLEQARIAAGARTARFIRPDQRITMEYSGSRLNLYLNAQDVVERATCG